MANLWVEYFNKFFFLGRLLLSYWMVLSFLKLRLEIALTWKLGFLASYFHDRFGKLVVMLPNWRGT